MKRKQPQQENGEHDLADTAQQCVNKEAGAKFRDRLGFAVDDDGEEDAFAAALADEDSIRLRLSYYF